MDVLDAKFVASASAVAQLPAPAFAEVAFAGRSNVGKSSLINSLVQRKKLVRTSSTPGCTRAVQIFRVDVRTAPGAPPAVIDFVDLPGYGYAQRSKAERKAWGPLIEGFLRQRAGLRAVVVIVDVRRGIEEEDEQLLEFLEHIGREPIVVATKLDKLAASKQKPALAALEKASKRRVIGYSAADGTGRDVLLRRILRVSSIATDARPSP